MQFPAQTALITGYAAAALVLALAVLVIAAVIKALRRRTSAAAPTPAEAPAPCQTPAAPGSAGQLKLHDVEPRTAAMLMAIVADKTGKALNELRFISIKEVK